MNLRNEKGATLIVVSITLLVLLGFAALAVDAGLGYNERRGTTNGADNAALAAAWESCNPRSGITPEEAAFETAEANGYANDDDTVVSVSELDEYIWEVTISQTNQGFFSPATPFANDSLEIVSQAAALCDPTSFLEGMAIFAGGDNCGPNELSMTGASIEVDGAIHSNGSLQIHATPDTEILSGPITYRESGTHGTLDEGPPTEYPLDIDISEYEPGGSRALLYDSADPALDEYFPSNGVIDNDWLADPSRGFIDTETGLLTQSGVFYSSYSHVNKPAIDLHGLSAAPGVTATFVAEGKIQVTGGAETSDGFRAHDPLLPGGTEGILFFSNQPGPPSGTCNSTAITFSSATLTNAAGIIYAPNGEINFSNSSVDLDGSIIGWKLNVQGGQHLSVTYQPDDAFIPKYQVELLR